MKSILLQNIFYNSKSTEENKQAQTGPTQSNQQVLAELPHLVEIVLEEELLEDVGELGEGGVALLVELDQLGGAQPVVHVEADVHADLRLAVSHLHDRHLRERGNVVI